MQGKGMCYRANIYNTNSTDIYQGQALNFLGSQEPVMRNVLPVSCCAAMKRHVNKSRHHTVVGASWGFSKGLHIHGREQLILTEVVGEGKPGEASR